MTFCSDCLTKKMMINLFGDPGKTIVSFIQGKSQKEESMFLSNASTHTLCYPPSKTTPCPCHCPHYMCDVCCRDSLCEEAQDVLYARMIENRTSKQKYEKEMRRRNKKRKEESKEEKERIRRFKEARASGRVSPRNPGKSKKMSCGKLSKKKMHRDRHYCIV